MKKYLFIFLLLAFFSSAAQAFSFSQHSIEVDFKNGTVKLIDFCLGNYKINGNFTFTLNREAAFGPEHSKPALVFALEGKNIEFKLSEGESAEKVESRIIPWVKVKLVKKGKIVLVEEFSLPELTAKGSIDLEKSKVMLNVDASWHESSRYIRGQIGLNAKIWGSINNFFTSGYFIVKNGKYKTREFKEFRLDFLGKPPLLNITDSQVILKNGSVLNVEGVLNLSDFSRLLSGTKSSVRRIFFGEWELCSNDNKDVILKKSINSKFDVFLDASMEDEEFASSSTEVRYNIRDDKFLKFKMHENKTILGFEQRREF